MKTKTYKLKIVLQTPMLGSQPTKDIASEFIAGRNGMTLPADEEMTLPDALEKGTTVFHRDEDGNPVMFDYQLKGFLKEAGRILNGRNVRGVKNLRSKVAQDVFVMPRRIPIKLNGDLDYLERPLRAETAQGPRVALSRSELIPEGSSFVCGLEVLDGDISEDVLRDLLDYGFFQGLLQWRGGGYGRFIYELVAEK